MPKVFVSYRRDDTLGFTGRVFDRLRSHFGPDSVVMDIDSIPFGVDFVQYITDAIGECDVVLAVIGDRWLGAGAAVTKRLDDPKDFVRLEIETALDQGLTLIPVLVGTTKMPREDELPAPLKRLATRNAISIDAGRDFHHHVDRLIQSLDLLPGSRKLPASQEPVSPDSAIDKERSQHLGPSQFRAVIDIVSGPQQGRSFELVKDRILIGRDDSCEIFLKDNRFLSRYHTQLVRKDDGYELEDLQSTNGSYVNGLKVNDRQKLKDGDRIHAGETILVYRKRN